jgi:hypothetical protein
MDTFTILHAIKAALIKEDIEFYEMVAKQAPVEALAIFSKFDKDDPALGLKKLTDELFEGLPHYVH